jgi:hypothetical protein
MSWVCEFAQDAQEDLKKLTRNIQERIAHVLKTDPFQGNVKASRVTIGTGPFAGASVLIEPYLLLTETNRQSRLFGF